MRKIIWTYGIIAGVIVSAMLLITQPLFRNGTLNHDNGMLIGYTSMIIAFTTIFVAVKTYRDKHLNGAITFGTAFQIGILITVVASIVYAVTWEVYFNTIGSDFVEWYNQCQLDKLTKEGASVEKIEQTKAQLAQFAELYKNPFIRFGMTLVEIFPVGLIITLVCAGLLRKSNFLPSE